MAPYWRDKLTSRFAAVYGTPTIPGKNALSITITSSGHSLKRYNLTDASNHSSRLHRVLKLW
jgi:hypothetical protein